MKMAKKNILVFPGGTEIGLEIWNSLKEFKEVELFSAGSPVSNHAPYVFKNHSIIPNIRDEKWIDVLNDVVKKRNIDYIFPGYDDVLLALSQNSTKINAEIITSPLNTCIVTRSKRKTYELFRGILPVPKTFENISEIKKFPVFIKPDKGQGSQHAEIVNDSDTLKFMLKNHSDLIILEYLPGKEYTIDCFSHRRKGLLFCGGRERIRTKNGISMNSKPVPSKINKIFKKFALRITDLLELHGAWFFQLKQDSIGKYKLLEIAPRISGTMATHRVLGVNFPLLSIYEKEGFEVSIMINENHVEIDRALTNCYKHDIYYNKVYVDLDDTIIVKNKINTNIVKFLYQAINEGCQIILISKTVNDIESYLKKWKLECIFDEVIILKKEDCKANYINPKNAIFIDDSFSERESVFLEHHIPTFDSSMIEILIDFKVGK